MSEPTPNESKSTTEPETNTILEIIPSHTIKEKSYNELQTYRENILKRIKEITPADLQDTSTDTSSKRIKKHKSNDSIGSSKSGATDSILSKKSIDTEANPNIIHHQQKKIDVHWDYLLKEMMWLSADFTTERKRQTSLAKKQSSSVKQHFKTKSTRLEKAKLAQEANRRKLSSKMSKMVMNSFWKKIEKIIMYKQKLEMEDVNKVRMERKLMFLVSQTERYGDILRKGTASLKEEEQKEELNSEDENASTTELISNDEIANGDDESTKRVTFAPSVVKSNSTIHQEEQTQTSHLISTSNINDEDDDNDEYTPQSYITEEHDDETTMDIEEQLHNQNKNNELSYEQEIDVLKEDADIPLEELQAMYAKMNHEEQGENSEEEDQSEEEEDFEPENMNELDDETTIDAEEKLGRDMSYEDELKLLQQDCEEMPIEELRAMYDKMEQDLQQQVTEQEMESDSESVEQSEEEEEYEPINNEVDDETTIEAEERLGRDISYEDEIKLLQQDCEEMSMEELRAMHAKMEHDLQQQEIKSDSTSQIKKRSNEESDETNKKTKIEENETGKPYLISSWVKLRKYQQLGVSWLVHIQQNRLNGILADEMGLGKTLQTISLLAHLASNKGIWGPHLIIVPTSCIVNWECELKRFCPSFKVLCYYGTTKKRKMLRQGWTKMNFFHVVITSYQLAVQDSFAFKRKRWYYLVLDEAHNIKNFQSQRWQTLISFNSQRRLLLTGTPLQNNLIELWSLLHFLMPHVFRSSKEFSYWFSNPMNTIVEKTVSGDGEGITTQDANIDLITRLHGIIRPFVLRRLKKDVEKQMPGKFEHIIKCCMSRRQIFLYEEFMSRSSTRMALKSGGNYMAMMNVLMQLRKVCNHPDLFEPRSVVTPFVMENIQMDAPSCIVNMLQPKNVLECISDYWWKHPIWSHGCGTIESLETSMDYDDVQVEQLKELDVSVYSFIEKAVTDKRLDTFKPKEETKPELIPILTTIYNKKLSEAKDNAKRNHGLNSNRCSSQISSISNRSIKAVSIDLFDMETRYGYSSDNPPVSIIANTPNELLAMRKSQQQRAEEYEGTIQKFLVCIPKANSKSPQLNCNYQPPLFPVVSRRLEKCLAPFQKANARLTSYFPDLKLIQFDAGKLQILAELLRDLKRGSHRVLIFTQMSKMLDILESFLNLHGHTYLRLDGSTSVDARQHLMDRFNNDTKLFCFILSTRSGGLGINLTGADTVIFYDSDWNPAMDAQAQDRAHRIGQTKDVHIYRLITEHTVEENILMKAKQKRRLDFLVMEEGKFHSADNNQDEEDEGEKSVFTKGGLRDILGFVSEQDDDQSSATEVDMEDDTEHDEMYSREQIENAMTTLEDEDDVIAMRGAQKEVADELQEFDDVKIEDSKVRDEENGDDQDSVNTKNKPIAADTNDDANETTEEFAAWQSKIGNKIDMTSITAALRPTELYALSFRETIDPYYSEFYVSQEQKRQIEEEDLEQEWNIQEIEQIKAAEEQRALSEGELLATNITPGSLPRLKTFFLRERAKIRARKMKRRLTGENWEIRVDAVTKYPFYYNLDTGEAVWDKPAVLLQLEADELARAKKWTALPHRTLVHIMSYLIPYPERMVCTNVSRQWRAAASDISFVKHVYPVEMGALVSKNLAPTSFRNLSDALASALPGDTIELGDGHYWLNELIVTIDVPVRIIGDEHDPSHVVLEMSGTIVWRAKYGFMEGVTMRRPNVMAASRDISSQVPTHELLRIEDGRINMIHSVLDNDGSEGSACILRKGSSLWQDVTIKSAGRMGYGILLEDNARLRLFKCHVLNNRGKSAILCANNAILYVQDCSFNKNIGPGIHFTDSSIGQVLNSTFVGSNFLTIEATSSVHHDKNVFEPNKVMVLSESDDNNV